MLLSLKLNITRAIFVTKTQTNGNLTQICQNYLAVNRRKFSDFGFI